MEQTYTLYILNTFTLQYEEVEVTEEVYNEYRRGNWNIAKNDAKHRKNEIPFSALIGGNNGAIENFSELIDNSLDPESIVIHRARIRALYSALRMLPEMDNQLISALFFNDFTERKYADRQDVAQSVIHAKKERILKSLKENSF